MKKILFRTSLVGILAGAAYYAQTAAPQTTPRYAVTDLGALGGTFSISYGINNAGRVAGAANVHGDKNQHPFFTGIGGTKYDLGTLGGPNAQASAPNGANDIPIVSEIATPDPLGQDFCGFGTHLICIAGLWNGAMSPLPTLGGNNAMAFAMNNRGQIIGVSENRVHDPACPSPQVLGYQAALWGPNVGTVQALPGLAGDTVGFALGINDLGQVVGSSGTCANTGVTAVGLLYGPHAVLWDNGSAIDLGSLGGKTMGKACSINNRGEVTGFSSLPGDKTVHPFLWTKETGMQDLGGLGADTLGDSAGLNNATQVVGGSCDNAGNCRAFLWEKNLLSDLNDLIAADSPMYLVYALGINDAGEIVGFAVQKKTGDIHAYLATPIRGASAKPAAPVVTSDTAQYTIPANIRMQLRLRLPFDRLRQR
jgi:probable HAF family extracellular repeat protein